uniref:Uncharacterized protein n=1 Tax=Aegilops tauschii subsp. strangulata TaxID=200361 RepID=A0A453B233_AEGTS
MRKWQEKGERRGEDHHGVSCCSLEAASSHATLLVVFFSCTTSRSINLLIQDLAQESAAYAGRHGDGESVTMVALLSSGEQINRGTLILWFLELFMCYLNCGKELTLQLICIMALSDFL